MEYHCAKSAAKSGYIDNENETEKRKIKVNGTNIGVGVVVESEDEDKKYMPWIEKYRPTHFDGIVLDPLNRTFFCNILEKRHFPNLLFYGPPGTGKTTTIINLINEYQDKYFRKNRESIIHLNASDERGIDIIRTQIYQFVKSKHIFEVGLKFVILDEVDYMTKNAQQALKTLLQTSLPNVRFCLICNYISKIDESLQHEFICVRFNQLPRKEVRQFIYSIVAKESIEIEDVEIDQLCDTYHSDIRSMINYLQSSYSSNMESASKTQCNDWEQLHHIFIASQLSSPDANYDTVMKYLQQISCSYGMHKRNIMLNYLNYVIRNHSSFINDDFLQIVETVVHANESVPSNTVCSFFVSHLLDFYRNI